MYRPKMTTTAKVIWTMLVIGFAAMVFPGVFFFQNVSEPFLFGMPFIYGYIILWWAYICAVTFYAYKKNWGQKEDDES